MTGLSFVAPVSRHTATFEPYGPDAVANAVSGDSGRWVGFWRPASGSQDYYIAQGDETYLLLDGEVTVEVEGHGTFDMSPGDTVTSPKGQRLRWDIRSPSELHFVMTGPPEVLSRIQAAEGPA